MYVWLSVRLYDNLLKRLLNWVTMSYYCTQIKYILEFVYAPTHSRKQQIQIPNILLWPNINSKFKTFKNVVVVE